jgi:hypothetical protein
MTTHKTSKPRFQPRIGGTAAIPHSSLLAIVTPLTRKPGLEEPGAVFLAVLNSNAVVMGGVGVKEEGDKRSQ